MKPQIPVLVMLLALIAQPGPPQQANVPLGEDQVMTLVKAGMATPELVKLIHEHGIDFELTDEYLKSLRHAGAQEAVIQALHAARPKPLTRDQVMELVAQGVPAERAAMLVRQRGISFVPDDRYLQTLRLAGGDDALIAALRGLVSAASAHAGGAQLEISTQMVTVYAVVRDKYGHLIADLNKDDFTLLEDQQPQVITYFSREVDTPLAMGIIVDTSSSQGRALDVVKPQAKAFLRQVMRPQDQTFIVHFDEQVELLQDATSDLSKLETAIEKLESHGGGRAFGTFYDAVYLLSTELLNKLRGRKVLILLTLGEDQGSKKTLVAALEAGQKAGAIIYSIDTSDPALHRQAGFSHVDESASRRLSDETGGRVFKANNDRGISEALQQIAGELRTQYLLGYTPTNTIHDRIFLEIEMKVRTGNVEVGARNRYYVPAS